MAEREEEMAENEEERGVQVIRILLIECELVSQAVSRIIVSVHFVEPERFLIERIEPECKAQEEAEQKSKEFPFALPPGRGGTRIQDDGLIFERHRKSTPQREMKYA